MGSRRRISRRSLFKTGATTAAGAAVAGTAVSARAQEASEPPDEITASSLGMVASVSAQGSLEIRRRGGSRVVDTADPEALAEQVGPGVLDQPPDSTIVLEDPVPREPWEPGHEVVLIEAFEDGHWNVTDVQRLYRPIEQGTRVTGSQGNELVTESDDLVLTDTSEPRGDDPDYEAVPLASIEAGDVVAGIGYLDPTHTKLEVAQLGVRRPDS